MHEFTLEDFLLREFSIRNMYNCVDNFVGITRIIIMKNINMNKQLQNQQSDLYYHI